MSITLKQFTSSTSIPAKLIRSTVKQFGGWEYFTESANDIASHGAQSGWSGFTYYADTVPFAKRNKKEIIAYSKEMMQDIGEYESLPEFFASFNCLKDYSVDEISEALYHHLSENLTALYNALAWFALEEVARAYVNLSEGYN